MRLLVSTLAAMVLVANIFGQGTVTFDESFRNVKQTNLNLRVATLTNTAATATSIAGYNADKKLASISIATNLTFDGTTLGVTNVANAQIAAGANISESKVDTLLTRDTEWDTEAEVEAIWGGNIIKATEIDTEAELETILGGINLLNKTAVDTQAEFESLLFALPSGGGSSTLSAEAAAGATTVTLSTVPAGLGLNQGYIVIDAWTTNAEIRRVSSVAGNVVTLVTPLTKIMTTLSFDAATKKITATAAETISQFFPGARITITGSASNNGTFTVADYPAKGVYDGTYITVNEALVNEAAGASVTVTMNLNRTHPVGAQVIWTGGPTLATWYGAKPSGATADAAANRIGIQRMLDDAFYCNFSDVYFPGGLAGRYYINAPLYVEKLTHLQSPHHKSGVIAATSAFPTWNDDVAMLVTRRNGLPCRAVNGGNDRYYITGLGIDGVSVAYLKSPSYTSSARDGNGYTETGTTNFAIHATLTKKVNEHSGLVFRALSGGTGGNAVRIAFVNNGASQSLDVTVAGNDITVALATSGASAVTSTANDVLAAVNADAEANLLVQASLLYGDDGTGVVTAFAMTAFMAGSAPFVAADVGRSIYVGRKEGARHIVALVNAHTVHMDGDAWDRSQAGTVWAVSPINGLLGSYNQTTVIQDLRIEETPGYAFYATGCQEATIKNLLINGAGIHVRIRDSQFVDIYNLNCEKGADTFVSHETSSSSLLSRQNNIHTAHFEGQSMPIDAIRGSKYNFSGNFFANIFWTIDKASTVLKLRGNFPSTYGFVNMAFSGPNSGPLFIDDDNRGYKVLMTAFASSGAGSQSFVVPHWFVNEGGIDTIRNVVSKTTTYTATVMDEVILADATGGAFTVTLPSATFLKRLTFTIKRANSGANAVTVGTTSGQTFVDTGATTFALNNQHDLLRVVSDGANWRILDRPVSGVAKTPATAAENIIEASADVVPLTIDGRAAGQTARLTEWRSTADAVLSYVKADGDFGVKRRLIFQESPKYSIENDLSKFEVINNAISQLSIDGNGNFTVRPGLSDGRFIVGAAGSFNARLNVGSGGAADVAQIIRGVTSQTGDLLRFENVTPTTLARFNKGGYLGLRQTTAPADADVSTSEIMPWLDHTVDATMVKFKAKDSSGTVRNGALALEGDSAVSLTADDQAVATANVNYISLSSDNGTAANRTFTITAGYRGKRLTIEWTGTNAGEIVDDSASGGGAVRLSATWTPTQYDTLSLIHNGTDWIETGRSAN